MSYGRPLTHPEPIDPPRRLGPMETLTFGWIGIALAGGAYPVVQIFLDVGMPPLPSRILAALMMSGPAFSLGFVYAGMAATLMVATAWTFAAFARIGGAPIWLASLAGGWTGFLCVLPFARNLSGNVWFDVLLATAMGQVGAAWTAGVAVRRNRRALGIEREPQRTFRIGLRQLFGATTFFCILAAVLGAVSPAPELYQLMAAAALLQANLTLAGLIGARVLSTSDGQ
ncbi:MAG TPA: hypothetical protein VF175_09380, partial [Lacipirellula sp.]